jgi:hypothetical protein
MWKLVLDLWGLKQCPKRAHNLHDSTKEVKSHCLFLANFVQDVLIMDPPQTLMAAVTHAGCGHASCRLLESWMNAIVAFVACFAMCSPSEQSFPSRHANGRRGTKAQDQVRK